MDKKDLLNLFRNKITRESYRTFIREIFNPDQLFWPDEFDPVEKVSDGDKGFFVGEKCINHYNIGFYYYEIGNSSVIRKKVGLRKLLDSITRGKYAPYEAAIVAFTDDNHWRLSFICNLEDEATDAKRYTFVFGDADNLYKTPLERFGKLQQKGISKKNIQDAFSVEALNDQFFADYKAHYEAFVEFITGKRFVKEGGEWVEKVMHDPHPTIYPQFKCDDKSVRDYVKQMMGRIVFLHFLQKKGWMGVPADAKTWEGGDQNFMFKLFQCATPAQKNDFLDTVLEPLFFECLNTERERDIYVTPVEAIGKVRIPYLNGELFEKTELDKTECKFDVKLFENLFNLFNSYNFTIDENDPSDAEIGVDPEMLGKIFENLLEDNKDKGAFYTPKEIVSYMCKESLIAYLQSKFGKAHHDSIRTLVNTHLKDQHLEEDQNVCGRLNKALRDVKVCDPAIGSGAFPMGLLNEIFACRCQLETTDKPKSELKGEIIQNNIYGVDIERGAVDIARLRFWLALIVDAEKPVPLPNLDYKIMQGNSLLESYKGQDLTKFMENAFAQPFAIQLNKDLKKYFKETDNEEKLRLRKSMDYTIKQCIFQCGIQDEIKLPNTDFFLWHTYFKDVFAEGGFDIVIGNPPYIKEYENRHAFDGFREYSQYYIGKMDLWYGFACHGLDMTKPNGVLAFIAQNNWTTSAGAKKMRKKIAKDATIIQLLDFNDYMVFEDASIQTMVMFFRHNSDLQEYSFENHSLLNNSTKKDFLNILDKEISVNTSYKTSVFKRKEYVNTTFVFPEESAIINKLKKDKTYLNTKEVGQGIIPAPDDYFIVDNPSVFSEGEQKFIVPFYTGILDRYTKYPVQKYLIYMSAKNYSGDTLKGLPNLQSHFAPYKDELIEAKIKYGTPNKPYFFVHRERDENFFKPGNEKIVTQVRCEYPKFFYTQQSFYGSRALFFIRTSRYNMKFLTGVLNSKIVEFWLNNNGKKQGKLLKLDKEPLLNIPLPLATCNQLHIITIVDSILSAKELNPQADTTAEERKIDRLVYELYGLTNGEVKIIDPNETTVGSDDDLFKAERS